MCDHAAYVVLFFLTSQITTVSENLDPAFDEELDESFGPVCGFEKGPEYDEDEPTFLVQY